MNNLKIRKAFLHELPILLDFEQQIIQAERQFGITIQTGKVNYYNIKAFIESEDAQVLVAEFEGELIGSGSAKIKKSDPYLNHKYHSYLGFMYVSEEHRGKGVIRLIIDGLLEWSKEKGVSEICLDVYHKNNAAINAYEKIGFTPNLVEMRLDLKELNN